LNKLRVITLKGHNEMKNFFQSIFTIATFALFASGCATPPAQSNVNTNANTTSTATTHTNTSNTNHAGMNHSNMNHAAMDHANMQSSPNAASQPYDLQFIDTMIAHHQGAVDMARPAIEKARHNELRELARSIIRDQDREIAQMRQWREQWFSGRPQAVNMEMRGMAESMRGMDMNRLNAQTGNAYDLMFIEMMIPHHEGAITMAREALQRAEHPELKQLAEQIIAAQEREIRQMNEWRSAWR
jgi:uncharacterized protein (DUF305 family)